MVEAKQADHIIDQPDSARSKLTKNLINQPKAIPPDLKHCAGNSSGVVHSPASALTVTRRGNAGHTVLRGGPESNVLFGGRGNDVLVGSAGSKTGRSWDYVYVRDGRADDTVICGSRHSVVVADKGDRVRGRCGQVIRRGPVGRPRPLM